MAATLRVSTTIYCVNFSFIKQYIVYNLLNATAPILHVSIFSLHYVISSYIIDIILALILILFAVFIPWLPSVTLPPYSKEKAIYETIFLTEDKFRFWRKDISNEKEKKEGQKINKTFIFKYCNFTYYF